ncbi:type II toxin-antitoxin system Phd/YefM family antitoxin [Kribbella kalugense]|uniref:Antitoxin n=1 Tax=Kribbella kalugense TaxID=2512221 RepID=A0A4R7ZDP3_9ACTN|nr:type II toxin-antitoxin system prevent-host-death family antitoxin [Kribbella kalugense]TDW15713.1 prevent-host-death family protein [Kribbella kalugense]
MSESVVQYDIHDAKAQLSRILERVERGEEVIISRAGYPVAKIVPLPVAHRRTGLGLAGRPDQLDRRLGLPRDECADRGRPRDAA